MTWQIRQAIAEGRLVRVLSDFDVSPGPGNAELNVVFLSSRQLSRAIRVFVDFLINLFLGWSGRRSRLASHGTER